MNSFYKRVYVTDKSTRSNVYTKSSKVKVVEKDEDERKTGSISKNDSL